MYAKLTKIINKLKKTLNFFNYLEEKKKFFTFILFLTAFILYIIL